MPPLSSVNYVSSVDADDVVARVSKCDNNRQVGICLIGSRKDDRNVDPNHVVSPSRRASDVRVDLQVRRQFLSCFLPN